MTWDLPVSAPEQSPTHRIEAHNTIGRFIAKG
jgi:hypothetical protein